MNKKLLILIFIAILCVANCWAQEAIKNTAKFNLYPCVFTEKEKEILKWNDLSASAFKFSTGVHGLRIKNRVGEIVALPFQGQQIWTVEFNGRQLAMKSIFPEPRQGKDFLDSYGAFLTHCGLYALGAPGPEDDHSIHGELPYARFQKAWLETGTDESGDYIAICGQYDHTIAFRRSYLFEPRVKVYANRTIMPIKVTIKNLRRSEMEYMYLFHMNFRPIMGSKLYYTAGCEADKIKLIDLGQNAQASEEFLRLFEELRENPCIQNILSENLPFEVPLVMEINYQTDRDGWAHSIQLRPDGYADYIKHKPAQFGKTMRWIDKSMEEEGLGLALPSTGGVEGYTAEKEKGNIKTIAGHSSITFEVEAGLLNPKEAEKMKKKIEKIMADL